MWSEKEYWSKGQLYVRRAQSVGADDGLYAFWLSLAMEFVARAALSKVSPVLNADPKQIENIYYALGLEGVGRPRTVPLHSVFLRCLRVVDGFDESHRKFCDYLGLQRNDELHTGRLPFEDLKLQDWLGNYYEVMDILCRHLDMTLGDLLGPDEAEAAQELLKASEEGLRDSVKRAIAAHRRVFDGKPEEEREQIQRNSAVNALVAKVPGDLSTEAACPACSSSNAVVAGRQIRKSTPYYDGDNILEEITGLSEYFECFACGLRLPSASHLRWSGVEPQFTVVEKTSLHELQEFDYYAEYMNE